MVDPIAEEIERGDEDEHADARKYRDPWRQPKLPLRLEDHPSPTHLVLVAEAEKAQARLSEDGGAH